METNILGNLLDPAILFFVFGLFAALVKSNLEIPQPLVKFFSLYLLMSVGFKGGVAISASGFSMGMGVALGLAMFMSFLVPCYSYWILRKKLSAFDAAAIAATYGSVSAVTFITAVTFLERNGIAFGGHMSVALVVMESPAIVMAVLLSSWIRLKSGATNSKPTDENLKIGHILKEAFTDGAHLLLLGGLVIGWVTGEEGKKVMDPFTGQLFKGILAFFLMEMGLVVAKKMGDLKKAGGFLVGFAILVPLINATVVTVLAYLFHVQIGDAILLAVLSASASYIVVPAVIRYAIPEANPSLYFGMSLVITFPFNIVLGIPLYSQWIQSVWLRFPPGS